jgi:hypothetical protein
LAFEYDAEWQRDGFSISPFKLPLEKRVFIAQRDPFDGNFGVFNDSLPDGWGRLLLVYSDGMNGEHVTTIDGEGRNPTEEQCMAVAKKAGLDQRKAEKIINEVKIAVQDFLSVLL